MHFFSSSKEIQPTHCAENYPCECSINLYAVDLYYITGLFYFTGTQHFTVVVDYCKVIDCIWSR